MPTNESRPDYICLHADHGIAENVLTTGVVGPQHGADEIRIWRSPNNFTNHGVFQFNYRTIDWGHSYDSEFAPANNAINTRIRTEELSGFYGFLNEHPGYRPIVEYPTMIGDHFNPHYFSQWYHKRPVILGYAVGITERVPLPGGGVYGNTYLDDVLNLVRDSQTLHFRNHIAMTELTRMLARNVEYVIVHKRFEAEFPRFARPPATLRSLWPLLEAAGFEIQKRVTLSLEMGIIGLFRVGRISSSGRVIFSMTCFEHTVAAPEALSASWRRLLWHCC